MRAILLRLPSNDYTKTVLAWLAAVGICIAASSMEQWRVGDGIIRSASAQEVIEIVAVEIPTTSVFPGAAFYSKPGDYYYSRMWLLNGEERAAVAAGHELPPTAKSLSMLDALAQEIEADGWRPVGRGAYWYSLQYAR